MSLAMLSNGDSTTQKNMEIEEKMRERILNSIVFESHGEAALYTRYKPI